MLTEECPLPGLSRRVLRFSLSVACATAGWPDSEGGMAPQSYAACNVRGGAGNPRVQMAMGFDPDQRTGRATNKR